MNSTEKVFVAVMGICGGALGYCVGRIQRLKKDVKFWKELDEIDMGIIEVQQAMIHRIVEELPEEE